MGARLGTQDASAARADRRRELVSVPTQRRVPAGTDRPAPRWAQAVGAAVLLSVLETVRDEDASTSV
jgi:hypothetical protein